MERNETKRNGKERQKGGLWCMNAVRLRPARRSRTAGRQARHRVHFSWTQSNAEDVYAEGVWTSSNIEGVWTPSNAEAEGPSC